MNQSNFPSLRPITAGFLAVIIFTNGCSTPHVTRTEAQGTGIGVLGGAAAGAIIGKQIGGNKVGLVAGALIGAAVGAAIGESWAQRVEEARKKYKNDEERLTAMINASTRIQEELVKENATLTERVKRSQEQVKKMLADYDAKKISKERLASEKKDLEAKYQKADEERLDLEKAITQEQETLDQAKKANLAAASKLEQAIANQRKELANLQKLETDMLNLSTALGA